MQQKKIIEGIKFNFLLIWLNRIFLKKMDKELLGYRNYRALKKHFHKSDFDNVKILQKFLNEVLTGESDITDEGIRYLNEIGLDTLSKSLADHGGLIEDNLDTKE